MNEELTEEMIVDAIRQQTPMTPNKRELGGGLYYSCHWLKCGNTIHRYQNYCDQCGQRIDWENIHE